MSFVLRHTGASSISEWQTVQTLWSGYGQLLRCRLAGSDRASVIVKHVRWPSEQRHPRGWSTNRSHERKARSYEVESTWYRSFAKRCDEHCRVPECLAVQRQGDEMFLLLEDLDAAGFSERHHTLSNPKLYACLRWLAAFHARFMHSPPEGLWPTGTYWHLDTRPDELDVLRQRLPELAAAAQTLDAALKASPYQTLVHGDAKVANFCFSPQTDAVAAVDFQYVGGGCGVKDVAYFIGSCLDEDACEAREQELLSIYFGALQHALTKWAPSVDGRALERDWRALYPVAWTDFYRFLEGWSPGHHKAHRYTRALAARVLAKL